MTYQEYRENRQARFNALPIFFAFGADQFRRAMEERGLTENDTDQLYSLGGGGYYLKKDADEIRAFYNEPDRLQDLMKEFDFAEGAFFYEMCNHEYGINYQRFWDVCSCFTDKDLPFLDDDLWGESVDKYAEIIGWSDDTKRAYRAAERRYYRTAEEKEWY